MVVFKQNMPAGLEPDDKCRPASVSMASAAKPSLSRSDLATHCVESNNPNASGSKALIHPQRHNLKNRFELVRTLGEGAYGKVKLASEKSSGEQVAIKYVKKTKIRDQTDLNRIRREIGILSTLRHQHIVNIRQVFEKKDRIVLVMDCALGGELYDYINTQRCLQEEETRRIFRQIIAAVHYIHQNGIVHRDIKLENIILDSEGNVKIADFGLANYFGHGHLLKTFCGSPLYASPEIVNGKPYHGPEVDVWSLGVVLYTLAHGAMPFHNANLKVLRQQISSGDYQEPAQPCGAAGLIRHMLTVAPARRASVWDILGHWWVNLGHERTPDGRQCRALPLPAARASHRRLGPCSKNNAVQTETRLPSSGASLNTVPGLRCGKKLVMDTSFDQDEMLHDIGTSRTKAPTPVQLSDTVDPSGAVDTSRTAGISHAVNILGIPDLSDADMISRTPDVFEAVYCSRTAEEQRNKSEGEWGGDKNSSHWGQTIAEGIKQIRARVVQSLAQEKQTPACRESDKIAQEDAHHTRAYSETNSDIEFASLNPSENERVVSMYDIDMKPKRGILKRKGKFSCGDSGCCINVDDTSLKADEEECLTVKKNFVSNSSSSAFSSPSDQTFHNCMTSMSAGANVSHYKETSMSEPSMLEHVADPGPCPLHRFPSPRSSQILSTQSLITQLLAAQSLATKAQSFTTQSPSQEPSPSSERDAGESDSGAELVEFAASSLVTAGSCTCAFDLDSTKVVRRRKGILKNGGNSSSGNRNSLLDDARKRLSMGSLSSNSSADILDLSYDSVEGEQLTEGSQSPPLPTTSATSCLQPRDDKSFSLEGEFSTLSLETGVAGGEQGECSPQYPSTFREVGPFCPSSVSAANDTIFDYDDARHILQQAANLMN